jgi:hypothetical protein
MPRCPGSGMRNKAKENLYTCLVCDSVLEIEAGAKPNLTPYHRTPTKFEVKVEDGLDLKEP